MGSLLKDGRLGARQASRHRAAGPGRGPDVKRERARSPCSIPRPGVYARLQCRLDVAGLRDEAGEGARHLRLRGRGQSIADMGSRRAVAWHRRRRRLRLGGLGPVVLILASHWLRSRGSAILQPRHIEEQQRQQAEDRIVLESHATRSSPSIVPCSSLSQALGLTRSPSRRPRTRRGAVKARLTHRLTLPYARGK